MHQKKLLKGFAALLVRGVRHALTKMLPKPMNDFIHIELRIRFLFKGGL